MGGKLQGRALISLFVLAAPYGSHAEAGTASVDLSSLVGQYAHYDEVSYDDPQLLGTMKSKVITFGITEFALVGDELVETDTFCHAEHWTNLPVKSVVPDGFTRGIIPRVATVTTGGDDAPWDLWRPETPTGIGVRFDDPVGETMPVDANDPRISDDDRDGHPGVTVYLQGGLIKGELYLARRERFAYELRVITQDLIRGVVHDQSEQVTLGARPFFLAHGRFRPVQHQDLSKSPIILRRLPHKYDCDQLMAERQKYFLDE